MLLVAPEVAHIFDWFAIFFDVVIIVVGEVSVAAGFFRAVVIGGKAAIADGKAVVERQDSAAGAALVQLSSCAIVIGAATGFVSAAREVFTSHGKTP
jgi:hypothetical protein